MPVPPSFVSIQTLFLFLVVLVTTVGTVRLALAYLRHKQILDMPNHRSSHHQPTPRGGGLGVIPPLLLAIGVMIWAGWIPGRMVGPLAGAALLFVISFVDDLVTLSAGPRFLCHIIAAGLALAGLPSGSIILPDGPLWFWIDRGIALLALVWWINLFNFMDGIDGISGVETACLGLGLTLIAAMLGGHDAASPGWVGVALAGAAFGFLVWNWHPARLFLGDVGSVPLGLLTGIGLFALAQAGALSAAILLSLVYSIDATATLLRRAKNGEKVWEAHRTHAYQRAVQAGLSHAEVSLRIAGWNGLLVFLAWVGVGQSVWVQALLLGAGLVGTALFLRYLAAGGRFPS